MKIKLRRSYNCRK